MTEYQTEIVFEVSGWPPAKNEATSLLAAGHSHADRVRMLLGAAREAAQRAGWAQVSDEIALSLVVRGPKRPPSDATNHLGGVGDVLQEKIGSKLNLDLSHLGELGTVALYANDRQIKQICYSEEWAAEASYTIRIRQIGGTESPTTELAPSGVAALVAGRGDDRPSPSPSLISEGGPSCRGERGGPP
ncbi:MAG TPA: hypothetical protein VIS06_10710 [Mycobacteriales bacterium]